MDYPPVNFHFRVSFAPQVSVGPPTLAEASFQEVSGISSERTVETYREGGRNEFEHRLPGATRFQNLTLRRGMVLPGSPVLDWCLDHLGNGSQPAFPIVVRDVLVELLCMDDSGSARVLRAWVFHRAWPVKWEASRLHATEGEVLVEMLELTYDQFTVKEPSSEAADAA